MQMFPTIFADRFGWVLWHAPSPEECSSSLKEAFKELVKVAGLPAEQDFYLEGIEGTCRIFVTAMHTSNLRMPVRLRSYDSRMDSAIRCCKIWEAARATTASLDKFSSIQIGPMDISYVDAGLGFSNPAKEAFDEAARIWHLPDVGCLVSVGAGASSPARIDTPLDSTSLLRTAGLVYLQRAQELLRAIFKSSTDCERTHEELSRDARLLDVNYFRFNVEAGFENIERYNASAVADLRTVTDKYLQKPETDNSLSFCALHLLNGYVSGL